MQDFCSEDVNPSLAESITVLILLQANMSEDSLYRSLFTFVYFYLVTKVYTKTYALWKNSDIYFFGTSSKMILYMW
jgi:hypothetical protein